MRHLSVPGAILATAIVIVCGPVLLALLLLAVLFALAVVGGVAAMVGIPLFLGAMAAWDAATNPSRPWMRWTADGRKRRRSRQHQAARAQVVADVRQARDRMGSRAPHE